MWVLWKTQLQVVTGLGNNILANYRAFAEKRSILSIVFFSNTLQLAWRLPQEDVWSEVVSMPFSSQNYTTSQGKKLAELTQTLVTPNNPVHVAIASKNYAVVPDALFSPNSAALYLMRNTGLSPRDVGVVKTGHVPELGSQLVYSVPKKMQDLFGSLFPNYALHHQKQSLLYGILKANTDKPRILNLHFCEDHFDLVVVDQKQVRFFNSFQLLSTEDVLYYILFVVEKLNRSVRDFVFKIYGEIPDAIDKNTLLKHLPLSADFKAADEFLSLKYTPFCES